MQLMTLLTPTGAEDRQPCMSSGGLVDLQTAAADDIVLLTDPQTLACMEHAVAEQRRRAHRVSRVA